jgi:hypothetical protein
VRSLWQTDTTAIKMIRAAAGGIRWETAQRQKIQKRFDGGLIYKARENAMVGPQRHLKAKRTA